MLDYDKDLLKFLEVQTYVYHENGGSRFIRNIYNCVPFYTVSHPRRL
jgi:hypothetical protein